MTHINDFFIKLGSEIRFGLLELNLFYTYFFSAYLLAFAEKYSDPLVHRGTQFGKWCRCCIIKQLNSPDNGQYTKKIIHSLKQTMQQSGSVNYLRCSNRNTPS